MTVNMIRLCLSLAVLMPLCAAFILSDSCKGRCTEHFDHSLQCACNWACQSYKDCCKDFTQECILPLGAEASCAGRCGNVYDKTKACQCNFTCNQHHSCCLDFDTLCGPANVTTSPASSIL